MPGTVIGQIVVTAEAEVTKAAETTDTPESHQPAEGSSTEPKENRS